MKKHFRIYADTSVFGGCHDDEFREHSRLFFELVRRGTFTLVVSETVLAELTVAPDQVRSVLREIPPERVELVEVTQECIALRDAYIRAKVVGRSSVEDAEHIAIASVCGADMVVSWNFRHVVHYDKIAGYNAVNLANGYNTVRIHSPREVV